MSIWTILRVGGTVKPGPMRWTDHLIAAAQRRPVQAIDVRQSGSVEHGGPSAWDAAVRVHTPRPTTVSGDFVRITRPERDALALVSRSPGRGRFHSTGEDHPLYAESDLAVAWSDKIASSHLRLGSVLAGEQWRVTTLHLNRGVLLDVTSSAALAPLGFDVADLYRPGVGPQIAAQAREMGAEGLLVPSRWSPKATMLVLFLSAVHRVAVRSTVVAELGLPTAIVDAKLRHRFEENERLVQEFASAIEDGNLESWLDGQDLRDDERRELGRVAGLVA